MLMFNVNINVFNKLYITINYTQELFNAFFYKNSFVLRVKYSYNLAKYKDEISLIVFLFFRVKFREKFLRSQETTTCLVT